MKRILIIITIVVVAFFCVWKIFASDLNEDLQNKILLAGLPTENIYLYAKSEKDNSELYDGVILKINNKLKKFDWKNTSNPTFYPKLILNDINKDNKKELIVILTTATGTELNKKDIHIIDISTLTEQKIEDPIQAINQKVTSEIKILNSKVKIELVIDGKSTFIQENTSDAGIWFNKVVYGNVTDYSIENGVLRARLSVQASPGIFIGDIIIDYYFKDKMYKVNRIIFEPNMQN